MVNKVGTKNLIINTMLRFFTCTILYKESSYKVGNKSYINPKLNMTYGWIELGAWGLTHGWMDRSIIYVNVEKLRFQNSVTFGIK